MEVNWTVLSILAICVIILIVYLFKRNMKDKKEVTKFFIEEVNTGKESDEDDEL